MVRWTFVSGHRHVERPAVGTTSEGSMSHEFRSDRRAILGAVMLAAATSEFGMIGSTAAASPGPATTVPGRAKPFSPIHQIQAGGLSIGYAELGPRDGPVAILLHGWPYDIHSFAD